MISVTILTKNSQKHLEKAISSLKDFDEVLIYDNGSTDKSLEIASKFSNVKIIEGPFLGFGKSHNEASRLAKHDWILSIDSDEIASPELVQEILTTSLEKSCIYSIPRKNIYNDKWIKWCGWHPDRCIRLYHRKNTSFSHDAVHESIRKDGCNIVNLRHPLHHYSYESTSDFLNKMQAYSELFAEQHTGKKSSSLGKAITHAIYTFFKCYLLKKGIFGGKEGFIISYYNANTAFYKYLKLWEFNNKSALQSSDDLMKTQGSAIDSSQSNHVP